MVHQTLLWLLHIDAITQWTIMAIITTIVIVIKKEIKNL